MLRTTSTCVASGKSAKYTKRCLRVNSTENGSSPITAVQGSSAKVNSTIDALDSLLPAEPVQQQQVPAASASQPATSTSTAPTTSSNSPDLNGWINLPPANSSTRSNPARDQQLRNAHQTFEAVMAFDGLAPEVINGRAAMLGFMAALSGETHGDSLFSQLVSGGFMPALAVIALVTLSSFAPAIRQIPMEKVFAKDKEPASFGPFTPDAELRNGRAAMLGLAALIFVEGASSQPFFL